MLVPIASPTATSLAMVNSQFAEEAERIVDEFTLDSFQVVDPTALNPQQKQLVGDLTSCSTWLLSPTDLSGSEQRA